MQKGVKPGMHWHGSSRTNLNSGNYSVPPSQWAESEGEMLMMWAIPKLKGLIWWLQLRITNKVSLPCAEPPVCTIVSSLLAFSPINYWVSNSANPLQYCLHTTECEDALVEAIFVFAIVNPFLLPVYLLAWL